MTHSIDMLQKTIAEDIFKDRASAKKAAGRALGAIVELITYYKLCSWGYRDHTLIETRVPEFGRPDIQHSVEFSLHRRFDQKDVCIPENAIPITSSKIIKGLEPSGVIKPKQLLSSKGILRNSCLVTEQAESYLVANIVDIHGGNARIVVSELSKKPSVIFECKRVGVEEGMKKGPQSIEKAKQGAYVARSVSSLQKVTNATGDELIFNPFSDDLAPISLTDFLVRLINDGDYAKTLQDYVLTVGVVSNHGNWFTKDSMNKELKVLAQSYDWLLFLTDAGISEFFFDCLH